MIEHRRPFAFISYSRRDERVATDIRTRLEKYVYSTELVAPENRPEDKKYVRPVFQDRTDLHVTNPEYWDDLKQNVRDTKYLIVICSPNSAMSKAVREGIDFFLDTHNDDVNLILPVFIDGITPMTDVIDNIVKHRNCPIYNTARDKAGHMDRKYCFYHILEYILHVDFDKLYNRYEVYARKKRTRKSVVASLFAVLLIFISIYGWVSSKKMADKEKQRAMTAEALTIFERKTFPYSLVVGYENNYLRPAIGALNERDGDKPHIIIYMPYSYSQLNIRQNADSLNEIFKTYNQFEGFVSEDIKVIGRKRDISLVRAVFRNNYTPIYVDQANTVVAFQYVVDYKFNSEENPIKIEDTEENRNKMVREYTNEFIRDTEKDLPDYSAQIHFVRNESELREVLSELINK